MKEQLVKSAFEINPDTVFGFLVLFMLLVIITLVLCIKYLYKLYQITLSKLGILLEDNTKALVQLTQLIEADQEPNKKKLKWMELTNYLDHKFDQLNRTITKR